LTARIVKPDWLPLKLVRLRMSFADGEMIVSPSYGVEIEISGSQGLLPGMVVTAKILTDRYSDLLYSSLTYFSNEFGRSYAYVVDAQNIAHKREVKLGRVIGEHVLIESGVGPGDKIVTSGAENLEEGSKVEIRK